MSYHDHHDCSLHEEMDALDDPFWSDWYFRQYIGNPYDKGPRSGFLPLPPMQRVAVTDGITLCSWDLSCAACGAGPPHRGAYAVAPSIVRCGCGGGPMMWSNPHTYIPVQRHEASDHNGDLNHERA